MTQQWDLFISHASEDKKKFVGPLAERLKEVGVKVWYDGFTIRPSDSFSRSIDMGLAKSRFGLVVISDAFISKEWTRRELQGLEVCEAAGTTKILPLWLGVSQAQVLQFSPMLAGTSALDVTEMTAEQVAIEIVKIVRPDIYQKKFSVVEQMANGEELQEHSTDLARQSVPQALTSAVFAYSSPEWLTNAEKTGLSELAKAAFVLLLFEQTETGCWGKSYLPRHLARGETLPEALGAITGTPFALLAISCVGERTASKVGALTDVDRLVHRATQYALFNTLTSLLQVDGSYLRGYREGSTGTGLVPEFPRHEAGACLIRILYDDIDERDLRTIERLCMPINKPTTYDFAVISRLLLQLDYVNSIPLPLKEKVDGAREDLLARLASDVKSASAANIAGEGPANMSGSTNQWSTAWYILPLLTLPTVEPSIRSILSNHLRRFFWARSDAAPRPSLLPTAVTGSVNGAGKSSFGTGVGLLAWRTLELNANNDENPGMQAQQMVERLITSAVDAIEEPISNPSRDKPEGYLGWGAICFGAASVGIRISRDDCATAIGLAEALDKVSLNDKSEKELEVEYIHTIENRGLLNQEIAPSVARAAARVRIFYDPVKQARERERFREPSLPIDDILDLS